MKRAFDLLFSLLILIVTLPVWIVSIVIIFISDPGPIFFRQKRVGVNQKEFSILKFRTMYLRKTDVSSTTKADDDRIFRCGNLLRKYKIDELPQVVNVILGDMSLVGPRPTVKEDVEKMSPLQKRRFEVKPGMTGLAQISGNTSLKWDERIRYDLQYIDNFSMKFDIRILLRTVFLVVSGKAETHPSGSNEWSD